MRTKNRFFASAAALLLVMSVLPCGALAADVVQGEADEPAPSAAITAPAPESVYPTEVRASEENGVSRLEKVYCLTANDDPAAIPTGDFEREGKTYTLLDILKNDQTETDTKDHIEVIKMESDTKDMAEILLLLEPKLELSTEDGYTGVLSLDHTSITVEAAGYQTSSRTVSATRTYPNLSDADISLLPKTVEENGRTLTLANVDWQEAVTDNMDGYDLALRYTALATYTGTATSKYATGYVVTADYVGEVTRTSCDTALDELDQRTQSQRIGFVQQSPENQIVTDKVWHELAFGLESLGCDTPTIRRKVAEMASFFGIQTWFYKNVTELSGGQKQLLNLASVMAMSPSVLILDEPTSQLDPIAASDFLATLGKINRELGTTIILTEHRLEEAFPLASTVAVMDKGKLLCTGTPKEVGTLLKDKGHAMFLAMPSAMRVWAAVENTADCPITVREGRDWLTEYAAQNELNELPAEIVHTYPNETVLSAEELWFKYEKDAPDVVKGLSLSVKKGEFLALLGGNGTGKTTSLKLLAGLYQPYRGEVHTKGSVGVLPQNPQALFVKKTVREDLFEILKNSKLSKEDKESSVAKMVQLCRLEELLDRHPYDLSGGEQQRAALAKVLLLDPEILLMDEPTKGLDAEFKQVFAEIMQVLLRKGVTILMVSHDVEFCARYAHSCALFFDGNIVTQGSPRTFFSGNNFYTTSANRMARAVSPEAVTPEDLISVCGGELPPAPELPKDDFTLPQPAENTADWKPKPLPWWRKLIAAASGIVTAVLFIKVMGVTDLFALINENGMTALAENQLGLYGLMLFCLFAFAFSISRRSYRPDYLAQTPKEKRKLSKRTLVATVLILLLIPITLFVGETYLAGKKYYFISLLIMLECMIPFFLIFESRKPQARELVIIAVLCAIGVASRAAFFMLPQFKPVMALTIIAGVAFGGETGFLVGAMTMLASNVMFSQGPWTPWQMFCMGIIGFLAGVLFRKGLLRRSRVSLCIFGALAAIVIYGGIMNPASALMWAGEINWKLLMSYYISGFPMDCVHAAATWLFLWFAAEPMLEKLDRIKVKYGLVE